MASSAAFNGPILVSAFNKSSHAPTSSRNFIFRTCSLPSHVTQRSICCFQSTGRSSSVINLRWKEVRQWQLSLRGFFMCKVQQHDATSEENEENISQATLIWRAIKLPIYSVALVPLTVGSAAAYLQTGLFSARRYFMLLASSVFIITWLNLSNDVYDFDTGADKDKKESVVNIVGSRTGTFIAACLLLALGFLGITYTSVEAANLRAILLLASAITCGYIYQCPPFRLSYQGLGEPLCFAAFGPFATTAFYLLQSSTSELPITYTTLSASALVGFTTSLILFCSHFHQVEGDKAVGKFSPLVRLGTGAASRVVKVGVATLYSGMLLLGFTQTLPFTCIILGALTIPMGKLVVSYVEKNHKDKAKIFMAKYYCVKLHALFGVALAAGLVAAKMVARYPVPKPIF
ncbi:1,4-dihydroxy-2-naphthoate polyprenyltransferase, chloroplastic isoform X1 [Solanum tuberosum]|uniref:ABC4 (ABERRANT CHLOROPLAST DEVELOPMENT 4) n=3 Tax=Solanum tuberosum TaxID=4113 RepID=M1AXZ0_SOLTU|nr:PREDICTED: 1,4-dihydroxy-2-naphthoate polyprenyltransferase, chloroplastic isoform X1 [Solanum tuberosum]